MPNYEKVCPECGVELIIGKQFTPAKKGKGLGVAALTRLVCPNNCGYEVTIKTHKEQHEIDNDEFNALKIIEEDKNRKNNAKHLTD